MDAENIYTNPPVYFGKDTEAQNQYFSKQKQVTDRLLDATGSRNVSELLVKMIYGEDFSMPMRLLDTKVSASHEKIPELADAIRLVESYNDFRGEELSKAVYELHEKGYLMEVAFGREGSPVFYAKAPYWEHQASCYSGSPNGRKYSDREYAAMKGYIMKRLRELHPDELDDHDYGGIRAWWD